MAKIMVGVFISILAGSVIIREAFALTESVSVPEPSTLILLGSGLAAFLFLKKKFKKL